MPRLSARSALSLTFGCLLCLTVWGCDDQTTPTGPSSEVTDFFISQCPQQFGGYQCRAVASFSSGPSQEVSGFATWSTSDPSIATVGPTGFVTPLRRGEVAVRAVYRGILSSVLIRFD